MATANQDAPSMIAIPPLIFLAFLAIGVGLDLLFPAALLAGGGQYLIGGALIAASVLIAPFALGAFRAAGTNFDSRKPATALITAGRADCRPGQAAS